MCGDGNSQESSDGQGTDHVHFHKKLHLSWKGRDHRLPLPVTNRYNFRVIITKYITLDRK
jgi:hypothetical protein